MATAVMETIPSRPSITSSGVTAGSNASAYGEEEISDRPVVITERVFGSGVGEFTLRGEVSPIATLDPDLSDNPRAVQVEFLAEDLGFGVGV
jgi:hypothetical protein